LLLKKNWQKYGVGPITKNIGGLIPEGEKRGFLAEFERKWRSEMVWGGYQNGVMRIGG
jgi:hypothetical protein